jgi:hypothetical protein
MKKTLLILLISAFALGKVTAQIKLNFQAGRSVSFSQNKGGVNDKGVIKLFPYNDYTFGIGIGYQFTPKTSLFWNVNLNSYGWVARMRRANEANYKADNDPHHEFQLTYIYSKYLYVNTLALAHTVWQKNKLKANITGGLGIYCTRCGLKGWNGFSGKYNSINSSNPPSYLQITRRTSNLHTFYNTLVQVGGEFLIQRKHSEIGLYIDGQISFGKNFENKVEYIRNDTETGYLNTVNRGLLFRAGIIYRPYINLKRKDKQPKAAQPAQSMCLPCAFSNSF